MKHYLKLQKKLARIVRLQYLQRILMWDEAVMMPEGAGESRAMALATLNRISQLLLKSKNLHKLLLAAKEEDNLSDWQVANLKLIEKQYQRAICIPTKLTEEATLAAMASEQAWRRLRPQNSWSAFLPYFQKTFKYAKEIAARRAEALQVTPYDEMLDAYAPGFSQSHIDELFAQLKLSLPTLLKKIIAAQKHHIDVPTGPFPVDKQKALGLRVMKALGFDFNHGRLDVSHHPFCSGGPKDVRITTRYNETEFLSSLMGICHETGHALYEQGLPQEWLEQPVGNVQSMAMHESQSLLIEMEVCRSLGYCRYLASEIEQAFGQNKAFQADNIYRLITHVKPGYIRVDADEVTYPMHVIMRYEMEKKLFNNEIELKAMPAYWNESMMKYLGLSTLGNDAQGVMQDVHWPSGAFGYFPAYTLGRMIAAQLFATFEKNHPNYSNEIEAGNFSTVHTWLKENVHRYGSLLPTQTLLISVTGKPLDASYFLQRIQKRYLPSHDIKN